MKCGIGLCLVASAGKAIKYVMVDGLYLDTCDT